MPEFPSMRTATAGSVLTSRVFIVLHGDIIALDACFQAAFLHVYTFISLLNHGLVWKSSYTPTMETDHSDEGRVRERVQVGATSNRHRETLHSNEWPNNGRKSNNICVYRNRVGPTAMKRLIFSV